MGFLMLVYFHMLGYCQSSCANMCSNIYYTLSIPDQFYKQFGQSPIELLIAKSKRDAFILGIHKKQQTVAQEVMSNEQSPQPTWVLALIVAVDSPYEHKQGKCWHGRFCADLPSEYNQSDMSQQSQPNTNANKNNIEADPSRFKIGKEIGAGTFGKVFEAVDTKTAEKVAIKEALQDKKYKNRELDVLLTLKHENIIQLKNYYFLNKNTDDRYLYMSMDLFETNLQALFKTYRKQKRQLHPTHIKIYAFQMFKALYYLNMKQVCHRDLKPSNILVNTSNLELKICDFGSSKIFNKAEKNVTYICSRHYRAPELLFDYQMYGTEVDVWSGGCILVEMLTREPIFPGDSAIEQLIEIIKIIGVPNEQYMQKVGSKCKEGLEFPHIPQTRWAKILRKLNPEPQLVDILSQTLVFDLQKRLTPFEVLKHRYFHQLCSQKFQQHTKKLPNLLNFKSLLHEDNHNDNDIEQLQALYCNNKKKETNKLQKQIAIQQKLETGDTTPLELSHEDKPNLSKPRLKLKI